ncbi:hypothetical protein NL676_030544 [Syzygium grande]|nr:hypothetical protein NL676_030544 [Syzygium grande]
MSQSPRSCASSYYPSDPHPPPPPPLNPWPRHPTPVGDPSTASGGSEGELELLLTGASGEFTAAAPPLPSPPVLLPSSVPREEPSG